jgi:uncharacterized membrane protein
MTRPYLLPVMETVHLAWQKVKGCKASFLGAYSWLVVIAFISGFSLGFLEHSENSALQLASALLQTLISLVMILLGIGILRLGVRRALDQPIQASMIFYPLKNKTLGLRITGLWFLYFLILLPFMLPILFAAGYEYTHAAEDLSFDSLFAGFIIGFCIVCSLYLIVRTRLGWAFLLDKELGPWQALKASFTVTRNNFWRLLGLYALNTLLVFISILPLGFGLIWSLPYVLINYGTAYRKLVEGQGWI